MIKEKLKQAGKEVGDEEEDIGVENDEIMEMEIEQKVKETKKQA